jgi:hypothetical protein
MGTRSTTQIMDTNGTDVLVNMYRQFDGYLEGHGKELAEFLVQFSMVNGLGGHNPEGRIANGMQCLAAQLISEFKVEAGGIYLVPAGQLEEYNYFVTLTDDGLNIKVTDYDDDTVFNGSPADLLAIQTQEVE